MEAVELCSFVLCYNLVNCEYFRCFNCLFGFLAVSSDIFMQFD